MSSPSQYRVTLEEKQVQLEKESLERHHNLDTRISVLESELNHRATKAQLESAKKWAIVTIFSMLVAILSALAPFVGYVFGFPNQ